MKIAKLSLDGYTNYGNVLQNYALQEFLKEYADVVDTIWHTPEAQFSKQWKFDKKKYLKFFLNYSKFRENLNKGHYFLECARQEKLYEFTKKYIDVRYGIEDLNSISTEYDYFVIGSDQVWNPNSKDGIDIQFLKFAPAEKRIAFSASMGTVDLPRNKKEYIDGLNGMKQISVREKTAALFLSKYTDTNISILCDPTFLVPKAKWESISKKPFWLTDEEYVLLYFLGPVPECVISYCKKTNYKIVWLMNPERLENYFVSPEEWLYLFNNANSVFTDSFHGMCFSIMFYKKLFVCDRRGNGTFGNMSSRTKDLIDLFDIKINTYEELYFADLSSSEKQINDIIDAQNRNSKKFIEVALGF